MDDINWQQEYLKGCTCDAETFGSHASTCEKYKVAPIVLNTANGRVPNMVEHPPHYNQGGYELADVIEAFNLPYHLGTVAKYVFRCQYKGNKLEDLRKAEWHLRREIKKEEQNAK